MDEEKLNVKNRYSEARRGYIYKYVAKNKDTIYKKRKERYDKIKDTTANKERRKINNKIAYEKRKERLSHEPVNNLI
jgi:hypothetical protein